MVRLLERARRPWRWVRMVLQLADRARVTRLRLGESLATLCQIRLHYADGLDELILLEG